MVMHSAEKVDNIFFACCILHNLLLRFDEFDSRWKEPDNWLASNAAHTPEEVEKLKRFYGEAFEDRDYNYVGSPLRRSEVLFEDSFFSLREKLVSHISFLRSEHSLYWLQPANRSRRKYDAVVTTHMIEQSRSVRPRVIEPESSSRESSAEDVAMLERE